MKISKIDCIKMKGTTTSSQTPVLCRIWTDEGIYGYGEAGVSIMHFSLGSYEIMKMMSKAIIGMDPMDIDVIYTRLSSMFWSKGNGGVIFAAISAIDTALWDIKAKAFNLPLHKLLGGKHRDRIRAYASQLQNGWKDERFHKTPGDLGYFKETLNRALDDGYDAIKIDFLTKRLDGSMLNKNEVLNWIHRQDMKEAEKKLETFREVCGSDVELIIENHCYTSANTAIQFGQMAQNYDVMFYEEPAMPCSIVEYSRIFEKVNIPLATGERSYTRNGFKDLITSGYISVIQPDIGNCGGVTECRKICDMAETYGVSVQTHTCDTPISVALALQLEAAIPNFIIHEHHTANTFPEITGSCIYDYQPVNGYFEIPDIPGIGNELTQKALNESQIETVQ